MLKKEILMEIFSLKDMETKKVSLLYYHPTFLSLTQIPRADSTYGLILEGHNQLTGSVIVHF